jgi:hypothetical protein
VHRLIYTGHGVGRVQGCRRGDSSRRRPGSQNWGPAHRMPAACRPGSPVASQPPP